MSAGDVPMAPAAPMVVLDACVLFPAPLRDTLLRAAAAGFYQPRWSAEILTEVRRNLIATGRLDEDQARHLIGAMQVRFPDAEVTGYQTLVERMTNDPKDRHVLAAAVTAGARTIVTNNLDDFPAAALAPFDVVARSPDDFLSGLPDAAPATMLRIMREQAADLRRPPTTTAQVIAAVRRQAPTFADRIAAALP